MSLNARLRRLEKPHSGACPECGGHGVVGVVRRGEPTEGCGRCGKGTAIEVGPEANTPAGWKALWGDLGTSVAIRGALGPDFTGLEPDRPRAPAKRRGLKPDGRDLA